MGYWKIAFEFAGIVFTILVLFFVFLFVSMGIAQLIVDIAGS